MKKALLVFFACFLQSSFGGVISNDESLVVLPTEKSSTDENVTVPTEEPPPPQIYGMDVNSNITNRYASTEVISKVRNPAKVAAQVVFSVVLPKQAFISGFEMEIAGKTYTAYVKEKEEAKKIYDQAVASGSGAGLVAYNPRESDTFTVSVNVEPESKVVFRLRHEELLRRQNEEYEFVINMNLGQIIDDFNIRVNISETRPLKFWRVPALRTGNEIGKENEDLKPNTEVITGEGNSSVLIRFHPNKDEQKQFAIGLGSDKESGIKGQFVVQYDVDRDSQGGEILVKDGYFVHFFAPEDLKPIPKHVVFVLDYSGSMMGQKIDQLIQSMQNILSDLNPQDIFHIVRFSDSAWIWDINANNSFRIVDIGQESKIYGKLESRLREASLPEATKATPENLEKAKKAVKEDVGRMSSTNMIEGLEVGLFLVKKNKEINKDQFQPIVFFLTDGYPSYNTPDEIVKTVGELNEESANPIYSLSFGDGADKNFLKKLSAQNHGFSRHIYEASDAALQLEAFYKQISNPLMNNVTFKYVDSATEITRTHYPLYFEGSEIVIAGKIPTATELTASCYGTTVTGVIVLQPAIRVHPIVSDTLERLWAYLTVQQLLDKRDEVEDKDDLTKKATDLALEYSFVTPVTSLVVVKPNETAANPGPGVPVDRPYPESINSATVPLASYPARPMLELRPMSSYPGYPGSSPYQPSFTTRIPTSVTGGTPVFADALDINSTKEKLPKWVQEIKDNGGNVTIPSGTFLLLKPEALQFFNTCPSNVVTKGPGACTLIEDCPEAFALLPDIDSYVPYFCPIESKYAGVCCSKPPPPPQA